MTLADYDVTNSAYTKVEGKAALAHLVDLSPSMWERFEVESETRGFCCDSGQYTHEDSTKTIAELFWHVALFSERDFTWEYVQAEGFYQGKVDWNHPVYFSILDPDSGEFTDYIHKITKKA